MRHSIKHHEYIDIIEDWFKHLPELPRNARDALMKVMPFIALGFGIIGGLVGVAGLGVFSGFSTFALLSLPGGVERYAPGLIATCIYLISSILLLAAYPGLRDQKRKGWSLAFWSEIFGLIGGLISFTSILSAILGTAIGLYLLFQIRSYYH